MTNNTETRLADMEETLRQLTTRKRTDCSGVWNWIKPMMIPFTFGLLIGSVIIYVADPTPPYVKRQTAILEQQAALGGAAIPFPNDSPSPNPSASPPRNSTAESTASLWTSISEPPSPPNLQADSGQKRSTRLFRLPLRRIR